MVDIYPRELSIINLAMLGGLWFCGCMLVYELLKDCKTLLRWIGIEHCKLDKKTRITIEKMINKTVKTFIEEYTPYYDREYSIKLEDIALDYDSGIEEEIKKMHLDERICGFYINKNRLHIQIDEEVVKKRWEEVSNDWKSKGLDARVAYYENIGK